MKFTIIIPCRNEKDIIEDTIFKLNAELKEFNYQCVSSCQPMRLAEYYSTGSV